MYRRAILYAVNIKFRKGCSQAVSPLKSTLIGFSSLKFLHSVRHGSSSVQLRKCCVHRISSRTVGIRNIQISRVQRSGVLGYLVNFVSTLNFLPKSLPWINGSSSSSIHLSSQSAHQVMLYSPFTSLLEYLRSYLRFEYALRCGISTKMPCCPPLAIMNVLWRQLFLQAMWMTWKLFLLLLVGHAKVLQLLGIWLVSFKIGRAHV